MLIHIVGDTAAKLRAVRSQLERDCSVRSELLADASVRGRNLDAIVVAADLRDVNNIERLKQLSSSYGRVPKRVFLVDQRSRVVIVQAYALGATNVLVAPFSTAKLLAALFDPFAGPQESDPASPENQAVAGGAACIAAMFSSVLNGSPIDVENIRNAGDAIAEAIAEFGLTEWLATVRRHHEGTFQHCLLVTGVAIDFGLSLNMAKGDIERLSSAAMFHDIGKARIPLAILDKPGRLDDEERAVIETHPAIGYEVLSGCANISREILDAVRHHHEYLDGSGYPDGLCAESISDIVRILTISDIFAALIEYRTYKPTMLREKAYEILCGMNGKLEEPLVKAFKRVALTR